MDKNIAKTEKTKAAGTKRQDLPPTTGHPTAAVGGGVKRRIN